MNTRYIVTIEIIHADGGLYAWELRDVSGSLIQGSTLARGSGPSVYSSHDDAWNVAVRNAKRWIDAQHKREAQNQYYR